jgi:pyruvate-formate lyase-activating enzyme
MNPQNLSSEKLARPLLSWTIEPYLHLDPDRIYNPLTDRTLCEGETGYFELRRLHAGELSIDELTDWLKSGLIEKNWLIAENADLSNRFFLKYVTLEATTACNQSCYFCPVSINPREHYSMPMETYEIIVEQLAHYRKTIDGVIMINYNEPTIDRLFVDRIRVLKSHGLPPAVNTNGSGLTAEKVDAILALGGLRYLSVNFSTLDRDSYLSDRGRDHVQIVLNNLDYIKTKAVAQQMDLAVLGQGDDKHRENYREIAQHFQDSHFNVKYFEVMDRAGYLPLGLKPSQPHTRLRGCDNIGSRPLQHLHITPYGKCILCCEDYDETHEIGDLANQSIHNILTGPAISKFRRWSYGQEDAPDDYMCRKCVFARTG